MNGVGLINPDETPPTYLVRTRELVQQPPLRIRQSSLEFGGSIDERFGRQRKA